MNKSYDGPMTNLSDQQLLEEWAYWDEKICSATSCGAALGAASEFRNDAARMLRLRGISPPKKCVVPS